MTQAEHGPGAPRYFLVLTVAPVWMEAGSLGLLPEKLKAFGVGISKGMSTPLASQMLTPAQRARALLATMGLLGEECQPQLKAGSPGFPPRNGCAAPASQNIRVFFSRAPHQEFGRSERFQLGLFILVNFPGERENPALRLGPSEEKRTFCIFF